DVCSSDLKSMSGDESSVDAAPARRRGRPTDDNPEAKRRLLLAARQLMGEQPAHRVSLRAVAERAGCDPALVNYYFGSKAGLVAAVLNDAAQDLAANLEAAYDSFGTLEERLQSSVSDPIRVMAENPYLPQLIIEQLVLSGDAD